MRPNTSRHVGHPNSFNDEHLGDPPLRCIHKNNFLYEFKDECHRLLLQGSSYDRVVVGLDRQNFRA